MLDVYYTACKTGSKDRVNIDTDNDFNAVIQSFCIALKNGWWGGFTVEYNTFGRHNILITVPPIAEPTGRQIEDAMAAIDAIIDADRRGKEKW